MCCYVGFEPALSHDISQGAEFQDWTHLQGEDVPVNPCSSEALLRTKACQNTMTRLAWSLVFLPESSGKAVS